MSFLFDPVDVLKTLESFPCVATELDPANEGASTEWFERVRKSQRQIYRVLGNTHYNHLTELLEALDACLAHGFTQPRLLSTRARHAFGPAIAELGVAEHFALADCAITGFDEWKSDRSVPDLLATTKDGFRVAVEVYCPMAFEHLARFKDDLTTGIKNIDQPYDFAFDIDFKKLVEFDSDTMRLAHLHPHVLDNALGADGRGSKLVVSILDELATLLNDPDDIVRVVREEPDINLRISAQLGQTNLTPDRLPARGGVTSGPSTTVPAPEWVFRRIAERAESKSEKGQALQVDADAAVLVVDLSYSGLPSELRHPLYHKKFVEILTPRETEALHGHTAIVFTEAAGWHKPFIPWFLNTADGAPRRLFEVLDPRGRFVRF